MKKISSLILASMIMSVGLVAQAQTAKKDPIALAKEKNCMACHAVDKKLVGPSYNDVKAKYEKDPKAVETLTQKVMKGGSGVWGPIPMPANPQVSKEEAETLVKWVLGKK